MGRIPIAIYKLIDADKRIDQVANLAGMTQITGSPASGEGRLFVGQTEGETPEWLTAVGGEVGVAAANLSGYRTKSLSGLYWIRAGGGGFVLSFGHAWQKIFLSEVEQNFGIRCVLNCCRKDSLRAIKRDRITSEYVQVMEQCPEETEIYRFGVDPETDLLRGVRAALDVSRNLGSTISGSDSFHCIWNPQVFSLDNLLKEVDKLSKGVEYRKNFSWIDDIRPIRDPAEIVSLDSDLAAQVSNGADNLSLCVPDFSQWSGFDSFVFGRNLPNAPRSDLSFAAWLAYVRHSHGIVTAQYLSGEKIHGFDSINTTTRSTWAVRDCIHGALHNRPNRMIHGGAWFEISSKFIDKIEKELSRITTKQVAHLSRSNPLEHEQIYNRRVTRASNRNLQLFDRKLIMHGGKHSSIEFCDLLSVDREIICVKRWNSSAGISHLCRQAVTTCRLLRGDEDFCAKVEGRIRGFHRASWLRVKKRDEKAEVVLAIMGLANLGDLPLFSRITVADSAKQIRQLGFDTSFSPI